MSDLGEEYRMWEAEVHTYFPSCPICGSGNLKTTLVYNGKDTLSCQDCGAKWHLNIVGHLSWAKLETTSTDGKGRELLHKSIDKDEWRKMSFQVRKTAAIPPSPTMPVTTREKDVSQQPLPPPPTQGARDSRMSQKKVVGRNVAIGLGLVCIILAVGLVMAIFTSYSPSSSSSITSLQNQVNSLQSQITNLQSQVSSLQGQLDDANSKLALSKSEQLFTWETVTLGMRESKQIHVFNAQYAGYVSISITSDSPAVTAEVRFTYSGNTIDITRDIGQSYTGTLLLPVLPSQISISVGTPSIFGSTLHVQATYYY